MQRHHTQSGTARPVHSPAPAYARKYHSENATNAPAGSRRAITCPRRLRRNKNMALSGIPLFTLIRPVAS